MITDKKARESALKLESFCNNHECEKCLFYVNKNCTIHKPRVWQIPTGGRIIRLSDSEIDEIITALAYKNTDLCMKIQEVKNNDKI